PQRLRRRTAALVERGDEAVPPVYPCGHFLTIHQRAPLAAPSPAEASQPAERAQPAGRGRLPRARTPSVACGDTSPVNGGGLEHRMPPPFTGEVAAKRPEGAPL